jgi:hypothetical protein
VPLVFSLACLIAKSYDFTVYRVVQGFFPGGIRLKMRFGIADSQVDALFRITAKSKARGEWFPKESERQHQEKIN